MAIAINGVSQASSVWNTISNPAGNQALNMGTNTTIWTWTANTNTPFKITDGTANMLVIDGRNTTSGVSAVTLGAPAQTIAGAAGTTYNTVSISALTLTTSTTTTITALNGLAMTIAQPTINQSGGAVVVTTSSTLYIQGNPLAGGSVTLTSPYALYIDNTPNIYLASANIVIPSNTTTALSFLIGNAVGSLILRISTGTTTDTSYNLNLLPPNQTIAGAAGSYHRAMVITTYTFTTSTATTITAMQGMALYVDRPTINQSGGAVTVTTASTLYVGGAPTNGGSVTITSPYAIYIANTPNIYMADTIGTIVINSSAQNALKIAAFGLSGSAYIAIDTRYITNADNVQAISLSPRALSFASAAGATYNAFYIAVPTVTLTGTTAVTAMNGISAYIGGCTVTDASIVAVAVASTLYIESLVAGGSATLTLNYVINTASGAFLVASTGIWTNKPSWSYLKRDIQTVERPRIENIWNWVRDEYRPVSYFYNTQSRDNPNERQQIGFLLDDFQKTEVGRDVFKIVTANDEGGISTKQTEGLLLMLVQESAKRIAALEKRLAERRN